MCYYNHENLLQIKVNDLHVKNLELEASFKSLQEKADQEQQ